MGSFLLTCVTTWLSLSTVWCLSGATPRGQPWTPVMTLPHGRDGLSVQLMVVLWPFRRRSIDRPVHRQFLRNAWLDLITILSATACHQRIYVEAYSKFVISCTNREDEICTEIMSGSPEGFNIFSCFRLIYTDTKISSFHMVAKLFCILCTPAHL